MVFGMGFFAEYNFRFLRIRYAIRSYDFARIHYLRPEAILPNYRRAYLPGGTWFFTVNLLQRHHNDLLIREIDLLRRCVQSVRQNYPFTIDAWVVLPDHLHCVLTLPAGDTNFSQRRSD